MQDGREGVGDGGDAGGVGVDAEGGADDDVAEVEGAGEAGRDDRQGEGGAFVGAGEVDLAGEVVGAGAGAEAGGDGADLGGGRAGRGRGLAPAPVPSRSEIEAIAASGQKGMPAILASRPGGRTVSTWLSSCSWSSRERRKRKVE